MLEVMAVTSGLLQIVSNGNVQRADKDNRTWCREETNKIKLRHLTLTPIFEPVTDPTFGPYRSFSLPFIALFNF